MSLDASVVGLRVEGREFKYDWKTTVLYALGIGARRRELDFLYEKRGPLVYPSFAVIPPADAVQELLERSGGDLGRMVHSWQSIRLHRPLPAAGTVVSTAWISGLYDLKRLAELRIRTRSEIEGELAFETEWTLLFLDGGGFGGAPPPKSDAPKVAKDAIPKFVHEDATSPSRGSSIGSRETSTRSTWIPNSRRGRGSRPAPSCTDYAPSGTSRERWCSRRAAPTRRASSS
jgi:hypothetical protein